MRRRCPICCARCERQYLDPGREVDRWARQFVHKDRPTRTREMLSAITHEIHKRFTYVARHETGTQDPVQTLKLGSGSCRDFALLMIEAVRSLGLAARFVSGYLYVPEGKGRSHLGGGNTHAWVQVYLPGAGWVEFDPTNGIVGNRDLIRVAVVRDPRQAVPLSGTWTGFPSDNLGMTVEVQVTVAPAAADPALSGAGMMQIRAGYELVYDCPQPTPMLLMLSVHPSRSGDLLTPHEMSFDPPIDATHYRDGFDNICTRIVAPSGRLTISSEFIVGDPGTPDVVVPEAEQHPVQELPDETLVYLLGSRYCETDRLSETAWSLFGNAPRGWARVQAICDYVHAHVTFGYQYRPADQDRLGGLHGAPGRLPRFRPSRGRLVPLHEYPGALLHRLSRRYRHRGRRRADGFQRLVRGLSRRPLAYLRRPPQQAPHRADPDGARPGCLRRGHFDDVRSLHPQQLPRHHRRAAPEASACDRLTSFDAKSSR